MRRANSSKPALSTQAGIGGRRRRHERTWWSQWRTSASQRVGVTRAMRRRSRARAAARQAALRRLDGLVFQSSSRLVQAHGRLHDMHHDVAEVDQHPLAGLLASMPMISPPAS